MDSPIKVFILGSCVSRDPFEIIDKKKFEIVAYYARSSFASLGAKSYVDEKLLSGIPSAWQRKMVCADMDKSVFSALKKKTYQVLLIDLIDERFNLSVFNDSVHTISSEYKKALYKPNNYKVIRAGSEQKLELWRCGLEKLSKYLIDNKLDDKVIVNQVYWSVKCESPDKLIEMYPPETICLINEQLRWMYQELEKCLPRSRIITYTSDELEIDINHKWGLAPFHFTEKAFIKQNSVLSSFYIVDNDEL